VHKKQELRNIKAAEVRAEVVDGIKRLAGYAIVFNSPSVDLGGFIETVSPGCFTRTLRESPDVVLLRDHQSSQLLGRTTAGTLTLTQDSNGLAFVATLPKTAIADDTFENVRAGNLDSCSFGFNVPSGGDKWTSAPDGSVLRTLLDVNLAEISITSFAAYPSTSVNLRSLPAELRSKLTTRMNENECDCSCPECTDNNCEECSDLECDDPNCEDCPNQERSRYISSSDKRKLQMRWVLASTTKFKK
jgi:uncharacterized protein